MPATLPTDTEMVNWLDRQKPIVTLNRTDTGAWEVYHRFLGRIGGPGPFRDAVARAMCRPTKKGQYAVFQL